jgi:glucose-1-phosphate cytidylyltransferase
MKIYAYYRHKDFVLCLGYKGEMIVDYFRNYLWNTCERKTSLLNQLWESGKTPSKVW